MDAPNDPAAATRIVEEGRGPALVLVHGVGCDLHMWDDMVPGLAAGYRVIRYDTLGHGATPLPVGDVTLADYTRQLEAVRARLGLDRFALVGFSMGVPISQLYALEHGARLAGLVLMNGVYDRTPDQLAAIRGRVAEAERDGTLSLADAALERWLSPAFRAARPDAEAKIRRRLAENDPRSFLTAYRIFAEADPWVVGKLGAIACPALVVTGEDDRGSTPAMSQQMAAELANARCVVMPGLRHMPTAEAPETVNGHLRGFLDALPRNGAAWA